MPQISNGQTQRQKKKPALGLKEPRFRLELTANKGFNTTKTKMLLQVTNMR